MPFGHYYTSEIICILSAAIYEIYKLSNHEERLCHTIEARSIAPRLAGYIYRSPACDNDATADIARFKMIIALEAMAKPRPAHGMINAHLINARKCLRRKMPKQRHDAQEATRHISSFQDCDDGCAGACLSAAQSEAA